MENSPSSHDHGCSNSQEIRCLSENLNCDDNYKTLHIKMWTKYSLNQYTNKISMYFFGDYNVQKNPPLTLTMRLTKPSNPPIPFLSNTDFYIILPSGSSCSGVLSKICIPFFFPIWCYMSHTYYLPCCHYVNNIWWRVTDMKLTIESSAALYSCLPLTSNILLTTLLSKTLNLCSSLHIRHQNSHPHNMRGTISVLQMSTSNILNWMVASIAWTYSALFPKIMVSHKFCQDVTYFEPDLQQSDSGAAHAMWH